MMKIVYLLILILNVNVYSKAFQDTLNYYPVHIGNSWQYSSSSTIRVLTHFVTLPDSSKNVYFNNNNELSNNIDTLGNLYALFNGQKYLEYKLNAPFGTAWRKERNNFFRLWTFVGAIHYNAGSSVVQKNFYESPAHPDSGGLGGGHWFQQNYKSGVGRTYSADFSNGDFSHLVGAIINGDTIGTITEIVDYQPLIPFKTNLEQNYPNPFNGTTTFKVNVARHEEITLHLYNMIGQKIMDIDSGIKPPDIYKYSLQMSEQLSSGIYLIILKSPTTRIAKRINYVK